MSRALLLPALATLSMSGIAPASLSPDDLLSAIVRTARAQRSVHYVTVGDSGSVRVTQDGDAGVSSGIQRITFRRAGTTGHVTVVVSANTAYIRGDAFTLVNYMGFKPGPSRRYSGRWVRIPHADVAYAAVAEAVRLNSTIDEIELSGPLVRVPGTTIRGQAVVGVRGKFRFSPSQSSTGTLYARANGLVLPVEVVSRYGANQATVVFSRWNEPIRLPDVTGAVPPGPDWNSRRTTRWF